MLREGERDRHDQRDRAPTPGQFTDQQIDLLKTFADQAVIAIENVRLFNETKEALERQTATAEILKVISSSPTDVQPVFEAIVDSAPARCSRSATPSSCMRDGDVLRLRSLRRRDVDAQCARIGRSTGAVRVPRTRTSARAIASGAGHVLADTEASDESPSASASWPRRSRLPCSDRSCRCCADDEAHRHASCVTRPRPGAFADKQIALLKTFADQAVIAIENVRLFNETKEALERQTATAEILKVIASSPAGRAAGVRRDRRERAGACSADFAASLRASTATRFDLVAYRRRPTSPADAALKSCIRRRVRSPGPLQQALATA